MTVAGDTPATVAYLAPECLRGGPIDDRLRDVYALGVTLYELVCGERPFVADTNEGLRRRIQRFDYPRVSDRIDGVATDLQAIVEKAMSWAPRDRYDSAGDLARDLRRYQERRPVLARRPPLPRRLLHWSDRHPVRAVFYPIVVVVTAVLVAASVVLSRALGDARAERARADRISAATIENIEDLSFRMYEAVRQQADGSPLRRDLLESIENLLATVDGEDRPSELRLRRLAFLRTHLAGELEVDVGTLPGAERLLRQSLDENAALRSEWPDSDELARDRIVGLEKLAEVLLLRGTPAGAVEAIEEAGVLAAERDDAALELELTRSLAAAADEAGWPDRADAALRHVAETIGDHDDPRLHRAAESLRAFVHRDLGNSCLRRGDPAAAEEAFTTARIVWDRSMRESPTLRERVLDAMIDLGAGRVWLARGRPAEALPLLESAVARIDRLEDDARVHRGLIRKRLAALSSLEVAYLALARLEDARALGDERIRLLRRLLAGDQSCHVTRRILASALVDRAERVNEGGDAANALALLDEALRETVIVAESRVARPLDSRAVADLFERALVIEGIGGDVEVVEQRLNAALAATKSTATRSGAALIAAAANRLAVEEKTDAARSLLDRAISAWTALPSDIDDSGWRRLRLRPIALLAQIETLAGDVDGAAPWVKHVFDLTATSPRRNSSWDLEPLAEVRSLESTIASLVGNHERALAQNAKACRFAEERVRLEPTVVEALRDWLFATINEGMIGETMERPEIATTARMRASRIYKLFRTRFPNAVLEERQFVEQWLEQ